MLLDSQLLFSDSQSVLTTAASTNVIDLGVARQIGKGEPLDILCRVDKAYTSSSNTLTVTLETADDSDFSTNKTTIASSPATATSLLVLGYNIPIALPLSGVRRYIRLYYTTSTSLLTGTISAGIVKGISCATRAGTTDF